MSAVQRIIACALILGLALMPSAPALAEGQGQTEVCATDAILWDANNVTVVTLFLNLILLRDNDASTVIATFYDVRGNGFYELPDGLQGRVLIQVGRWSTLSADPDRSIEVQFLNGPLAGTIYDLHFKTIISANVTGAWSDAANPTVVTTFIGTTNCPQP